MTGIVSIELLLDPASEERIRAEWRALAAAGMSSLAPHTSPSNRPHITVLVRETVPPVGFADATALLPLPISLGGPILFPHGDRGVLVRPVDAGADLLRLHGAVHRAAGPGLDLPHTAVGEWTPHVTLGRRLRTVDLAAALSLLGPGWDGTVVGMRRWDSISATVKALPLRAGSGWNRDMDDRAQNEPSEPGQYHDGSADEQESPMAPLDGAGGATPPTDPEENDAPPSLPPQDEPVD